MKVANDENEELTRDDEEAVKYMLANAATRR
jgi:hypothetical protein